MVSEARARELVEERIARLGEGAVDHWTPVVTRVERFARGWIVYHGAAESEVLLAGNAPYLVDEASGEVIALGTAEPVAVYIENYLRAGDPRG